MVIFLRASEVEIISDLDLVEVAAMEYKLSAFRPLTYRGQKKLFTFTVVGIYKFHKK